MSRFEYRVVTHNGSGLHSRNFMRCADAKRVAERLAESEKTRRVKFGPYEIERVERVSGSSVRYWMRCKSRWVPWDSHMDIEERRPDWIYGSLESEKP